MDNYQLILDKTIENIIKEGTRPKLLMHVCCAPCSSYCMEYLSRYFEITLYFYNPNISSREEYDKRLNELHRFKELFPPAADVKIIDAPYEPELFEEIAKGYEDCRERGPRCYRCYNLRLEKTAMFMKEHDGEYDFFTTTLSISPHKNAGWLNEIGAGLAEKYDISYLFSDFKKKGGYLRSIELSREYSLYRQDFCGCRFSKAASHTKSSL